MIISRHALRHRGRHFIYASFIRQKAAANTNAFFELNGFKLTFLLIS